jgi:hypothetical protein
VQFWPSWLDGDLMLRRKEARPRWTPPTENKLQLKVTLQYVRPAIWRRVVVPDNFSLGDLHWVIQIAMGWTNSHLHSFRLGADEYGPVGGEMGLEGPPGDEEDVFLRGLIRRKGQKFTYDYDFGDGWRHEILVEKIEPAVEPHSPPVCLAGKRACPPEDCGGPPGYANVLRVLKKAVTADDRELREWVGDYDPEAFDLEALNRRLRPKAR